jgi:predicted dehydrogenase
MPRRALVIGGGSIGSRHAANLRAAGWEVEVADQDPARATLSLDGAWEAKPEIAVIATPPDAHLEHALAAAEHGCHLLIEKPLADRAEGLDGLAELVRGRGLVSLVACNMRFHPGPAAVERLLEEGRIGRPLAARLRTASYLPDWRPGTDYARSYSASRASGGGVVLDAIHELDLACWLLGPARVVGAASLPARSIGLEVEGLAEIVLRHRDAVSSVHLSFVQRDYRRSIEVVGEEASLVWEFERREVIVRTGEQEESLPLPPDPDPNAMYADELAYFVDCVDRGEQTFNDVGAGLATLRLALAARELGERT